jgi:osmotically inducible protein OsmC
MSAIRRTAATGPNQHVLNRASPRLSQADTTSTAAVRCLRAAAGVSHNPRLSWQGSLTAGHGTIRSGSGALTGKEVTWVARTQQPDGKTSPEELCAAAHSACFSMALALKLGEHGTPPDRLDADATVTLAEVNGAPTITASRLDVTATVPGLEQPAFDAIVAQAAELCPVSRLFAGARITVDAQLAEA